MTLLSVVFRGPRPGCAIPKHMEKLHANLRGHPGAVTVEERLEARFNHLALLDAQNAQMMTDAGGLSRERRALPRTHHPRFVKTAPVGARGSPSAPQT